MGRGGEGEEAVRRLWIALPALLWLPGCASLNDTLVRMRFYDSGFSRGVHRQIRDGLDRREGRPPLSLQQMPAPAFLDQG